MNEITISALVGKTLKEVRQFDNEQLRFVVDAGEEYLMNHQQECCETVVIADICGELDDLVGSPIVRAEERSQSGEGSANWPAEAGEYPDCDHGSWTWTFYELATNKGSVTIRWCGTSNGWYSERVDFERAV